MARKKTAVAEAAGAEPPPEAIPLDPAVTEPPAEAPAERPVETNGAPVEPAAESHPNGTGEKRHPVFKVGPIATDKDNSVEAAVWDRVIQTRDGREFTVYSVTVHASWRDSEGSWKKTSNFRGSQIYALVYCLQRCSDWILAQRDPSTNCPF
ncbi:MAG TPA: hypothetical protein VEL76_02450 [Gemmataceae bacterium]|nr:hypothetical protein [Gemmataceae bacterium]